MICPHCHADALVLVPADAPWNMEYYICDECDSTFFERQLPTDQDAMCELAEQEVTR